MTFLSDIMGGPEGSGFFPGTYYYDQAGCVHKVLGIHKQRFLKRHKVLISHPIAFRKMEMHVISVDTFWSCFNGVAVDPVAITETTTEFSLGHSRIHLNRIYVPVKYPC